MPVIPKVNHGCLNAAQGGSELVKSDHEEVPGWWPTLSNYQVDGGERDSVIADVIQ